MPEFIVKIIPGAQSGLAIIQQSIPVSPFLRPSVRSVRKRSLHTVSFSDFYSGILPTFVIYLLICDYKSSGPSKGIDFDSKTFKYFCIKFETR